MLIWLLGLGLWRSAQAQTSYTGLVGTLPIELVLEDYGTYPATKSLAVAGLYAYTKFNTPIELSGMLAQGRLTLSERAAHGKPSATLIIPAFDRASRTLTGTWQSLATGQQLPITLTQRFAATAGEGTTWAGYELLETATLPTVYFKTVLAKKPGDYYGKIVGVKLFAKKNGRLVQQLAVADCQLLGFAHNVAVGDYNFDGYPDFSVFEQSYAGPNTSSLYFLYNPVTKRFEESGFEGVSLEFDAKDKRIYERNSCCAGTSVTTAVYKVVHNTMVPLEKHCFRWNEQKKNLEERPWRDCQ
ncbi:MAG: FG-GAP repeat protein [Janthinobacterium lividum]